MPTPALPQSEFDEIQPQLIAALRAWWDDESLTFDDATGAKKDDPLMGAGAMPKMDSKCVVKASPIIERLLGFKLPAKFIRAGGYKSFEDFIEHLLPQLREKHLAAANAEPAAPRSTH